MKRIQLIFMAAACLVSMAASAQWQWTDNKGRHVFSDRAPPVDILEKNILKRPKGWGILTSTTPVAAAVTTEATAASVAAASAPQESASAPKLSGVDKALIEKKKQAEAAEIANRLAEEEKYLKAKIENCARAKQAQVSFDSGMRMAQINEKGEREIMDEAARASEVRRIQSIINSDCR